MGRYLVESPSARALAPSITLLCAWVFGACVAEPPAGVDGDLSEPSLGRSSQALQRGRDDRNDDYPVKHEPPRRPRREHTPRLIGEEVSIPQHLEDGEEFEVELPDLLAHGRALFVANWTGQEGGGRPLSKGTGAALSDATSALVFPRNFNRISAPDANSCAGCHNMPIAGGGGDFVTNVFVLAQRFDFVTFDALDLLPTRGAVDEGARPMGLDGVANSRATLGMFGSGYIEMLARQMTSDLQKIRDAIPPGGSSALHSKAVSFGRLSRQLDGAWDTRLVEGLAQGSINSTGAANPPSLVIRPFHQAGAVVSLREFTNNAFNHHHGIQPVERFGAGLDPDGDGFVDEMSRADVTAATVWQATLPVPGRVIPRVPEIETAVYAGEQLFERVGCTDCHRSTLPLEGDGGVFVEPNPFNPRGNLQEGQAPALEVDLANEALPPPRLHAEHGVVHVPAYTDLKLHDITRGAGDVNSEPINMHFPAGSEGFRAGNRRFVTKKLWGAANEPPYFHHGKYTTLREAIEAHAGEAEASRQAYDGLSAYQQSAIVEFLKTLQVLPEGSTSLVVDERGKPRHWPPARHHGRPRPRGR